MNRRHLHMATVAIFLLPLLIPTAAHAVTLSEIEKQLMCYQCGCAMVLASCQCASADKIRAEIQSKLDSGISPQRIIHDYVAMYGEKVLSAPTKRGFNLTAWTLPFVAMAAGLVALCFIIREFVRKGKERHPDPGYPEDALTQLRVRIDEELKDYL